MTRSIAVLIALVGSVVPSPVDAQCHEGRVSSEDTDGRCCWPGQRWSDERARCVGPPRCPSGLVSEGDTCVRSMAPAPPPAVASPPPTQISSHWPEAGGPPARHVRVEVGRLDNRGLVGTGSGFVALGYLSQFLGAIMGLAAGTTCEREFGAVALIPIAGLAAGSVVLTGCGRNGDLALGVGLGLAAFELIGIIMLIRGAVGDRQAVLTPSAQPIAIVPFVGDRAAGLSARLRF